MGLHLLIYNLSQTKIHPCHLYLAAFSLLFLILKLLCTCSLAFPLKLFGKVTIMKSLAYLQFTYAMGVPVMEWKGRGKISSLLVFKVGSHFPAV